MTTSLESSIAQKQQGWLSGLFRSQAFWVFIAVIVAGLFLSQATDAFATTKNLYNKAKGTSTHIADITTLLSCCTYLIWSIFKYRKFKAKRYLYVIIYINSFYYILFSKVKKIIKKKRLNKIK